MSGNFRKCPFGCGGAMVELPGDRGPKLLFNMFLDPKAGMVPVLSGGLNRHPEGRFEQCDNSQCGFLALFAPAKLRR
jgi:hypothetical protein